MSLLLSRDLPALQGFFQLALTGFRAVKDTMPGSDARNSGLAQMFKK
jgi:hypothetical protein